MKQVQFAQTGDASVLKVVEAEKPTAGPGEVLIRVESASVNFADIVRRRGDPYPVPTPLPATPGSEVAGTVEAVGDGVKDVSIGDPVFAILNKTAFGGYSQFVVAGAHETFKLPEGFDRDIACTLVVAGVTAYQMLVDVARISPGDTVFIPGAAGGVGSYAIQIARLKGAGTIIAGAGSAERRAKAIANGADHAIDYEAADWPKEFKKLTGGRGADIVLDMIGGNFFTQCLAALAPFGRLVVYGTVARERTNLVPQALMGFGQSVSGYYIGLWFYARPVESRKAFDTLVDLVQSGQLRVEIAEKFPLEQAAEAHRAIEERRVVGKLVLKPWA